MLADLKNQRRFNVFRNKNKYFTKKSKKYLQKITFIRLDIHDTKKYT